MVWYVLVGFRNNLIMPMTGIKHYALSQHEHELNCFRHVRSAVTNSASCAFEHAREVHGPQKPYIEEEGQHQVREISHLVTAVDDASSEQETL